MVKLTVRLQDELSDHLTAISQILGITKNAIITDLLEAHIIEIEASPHYIEKRKAWMERINESYGT